MFDNTADDSTDKMFDIDDFDRYEPPVVGAAGRRRRRPAGHAVAADRREVQAGAGAAAQEARRPGHQGGRGRVAWPASPRSSRPGPSTRRWRSSVDRAAWRDRLRRVSAEFKAFPDIFDSQVKLNVSHQTRYLVTTEGTELVNERLIWAVHFSASGRAADGLLVPHYRSFYGASRGRAARREGADRRRPAAGRGDPQAARGAHDGPVQRPGHPAARGGRGVLPRGAGPPAGGRAPERQQGGGHLQGPDRQADPARLPHHRGRPHHAPSGWATCR